VAEVARRLLALRVVLSELIQVEADHCVRDRSRRAGHAGRRRLHIPARPVVGDRPA